MGSVVSSVLGVAGGAGGTGFATPQQAKIDAPTTVQNAQDAYKSNQQALTQQQGLLTAIQGQNGLQNQSQVYNQLQGVANGTGPNPAQAQLNQATGANIASQNALMAGQRGSSANVGLIARQAAQQGANTQQQAVGQSATNQANQSLNAINSAGNIAGTQAGNQIAATNSNTQAQQAEQSTLLNNIAATNATRAGLQANINSANAGLATTAMQGQQGAIGGLANAAGPVAGALGKLFGANGGSVPHFANGGVPQNGQYAPVDPNNDVFDPANPPAPSPTAIPAKPSGPQSSFGQFLKNQTTGQANGKLPAAQPNFGNSGANQLYSGFANLGQSLGNTIASAITPSAKAPMPASGPGSQEDKDSGGLYTQQANRDENQASGMLLHPEVADDSQRILSQGKTTMGQADNYAKGGEVPAMVSPGEQYIPPEELKEVKAGKKSPLEAGERIPGRPKFPGNDYRNDIVPKDLKSGGLVIPNEIMQSKNPHWAAMRFVQQHMANGGRVMPKKPKKAKK